MAASSTGASVPVPETVTIPDVPDPTQLAGVLGSADGILATFTDLDADVHNVAQSLNDHMSKNGISHDLLDTTQRMHSLELAHAQAGLAQNGARIMQLEAKVNTIEQQ